MDGAGDQPLAGPWFAHHEDRQHGAGGQSDLLENSPMRGAGADQRLQAERPLQLLAQLHEHSSNLAGP